MTTAQANHAYPNPDYLRADMCVRLGICWYCGKRCRVKPLPYGHITIPWCGCGRVRVEA